MTEAPEGLAQKLTAWEKEDTDHWAGWRKAARESFAFVVSDQWSKTEKEDAEGAGRLVTTVNRIGPMIDAVAGAEIIDRQRVQYIPRSVEDSGVNEVLTMAAEWVRDQTMADFEESDAFRDALICGLGFTETRMSYDDEPEGRIIIERVDPLEVTPDCAARKVNLLDARRIHRRRRMGKDDFEKLYPDATAGTNEVTVGARQASRKPAQNYKGDGAPDEVPLGDDEVEVVEWQWYEMEVVYAVAVPPDAGGGFARIDAQDYEEGLSLGAFTEDNTSRQRRKVFYRAVKCGSQILEYDEIADGEFRLKAITGKRDRNKGIFQGIVEAMKDPQRFANLFFSMLHHIIRTNAKGGIMAEIDAFSDPKQAQESWARSDSITWLKPGGSGKVQDKPAPQIPPQISQLLHFAVAGIKDASGINEELLGLVGRDQPGVLEHQRKQAAYAILAGFYDALRFYRKEQGGLLLKYMQKYLPEGYLVRIVGESGDPRYVPLTKQPDTVKFDVIVGEAPAGPNQKEKVWSLITNMQSILANAGPKVWAELIEYSPFPDKVNRSLKQVFAQQAQPQQPDPMAGMVAQSKMQRDQAAAMKDQSTAEQNQIETALMMRQAAQVIPFPQGM